MVLTTIAAVLLSQNLAAQVPPTSAEIAGFSPLHAAAHTGNVDAIRKSRLKKCTLFEMEATPEIEAVQNEYIRLAQQLWDGTEPTAPKPMKDRDLFDFLGFD